MADTEVVSFVKDQKLIEKRRNQMIQGAITLFKQKGFHKTTTREIAQKSGFSIGTLYEYIRTKEDVLFLVCDAIYEQVYQRLAEAIDLEQPSTEHLMSVVQSYFHLMDDMQEEVIIMYQEVKSLKTETKEYVLQKERDMVSKLTKVIISCVPDLPKRDAELLANNIFVQGQMWAFRRWALHTQFTLTEYVDRQLFYLKQLLTSSSEADQTES